MPGTLACSPLTCRGFGASERPEDLLSPRAMGEFLVQLIAEADLGTPHIVAPDVGTAAALFTQGLQTRGPLELDLGDRIGAL